MMVMMIAMAVIATLRFSIAELLEVHRRYGVFLYTSIKQAFCQFYLELALV